MQIYNENNVLIGRTDENDQIIFEEEYLKQLQNLVEEKFKGLYKYSDLGLEEKNRKMYLQELLEENDKEIVELTEEELQRKLEDKEKQEDGKGKKESTIEQAKKKETVTEQTVEEELISQNNGWEEFSHIIKVKETDSIYDDFQDLEKPLYISYDKSGNFVANTIGENGEPIKSQVINSSRSTMKQVMHIDDKGEPVKTMVPSGLMDTEKNNIKISVKIGQYGYTEAQKIQITHDNKYIATNIDKEGNYDKTYNVKRETNTRVYGTCGNEELTQNYEEQEEAENKKINLNEIGHNSQENLETVKRQVADIALENYDEMSREELYKLIRDELSSRLNNNDMNLDEIIAEVKETVDDEVRFPTMGERKSEGE